LTSWKTKDRRRNFKVCYSQIDSLKLGCWNFESILTMIMPFSVSYARISRKKARKYINPNQECWKLFRLRQTWHLNFKKQKLMKTPENSKEKFLEQESWIIIYHLKIWISQRKKLSSYLLSKIPLSNLSWSLSRAYFITRLTFSCLKRIISFSPSLR